MLRFVKFMDNPTNIKRLRPAHILMIRLHWAGHSNQEIAEKLGYTAQQVMNVLKSDLAQEILGQLQVNALDSADEVQQEISFIAPAILDKKIQLAFSSDDKVANSACTDILHMAGHAPSRRIILDRSSEVQRRYADKTEEELRKEILDAISGTVGQGGGGGTGQIGPDGKPLN